jgi:hypothetical protein
MENVERTDLYLSFAHTISGSVRAPGKPQAPLHSAPMLGVGPVVEYCQN